MKLFSKYHSGERLAQEYAGETTQAEFNGQAIEKFIIDGAINFISEQEYAIVSITDDADNVWASVLSGDRGFLNAIDPKNILIDINAVDIGENDVFWTVVEKNKKIGMLIIELDSRRRLRINGTVSHVDNNSVHIKVQESYPNCMKYIQRRHIVERSSWTSDFQNKFSTGNTLSEPQKSLIRNADTFFIGTANPKGNLDVSHRGGNPGFVEFVDDKTLRIPDYQGNSMFNTFGNLLVNNHAGVVFWDFDKGIALQMTGTARIYWNQPTNEEKITSTGRFWEFEIKEWNERKIGRDFTWEFLDYSPHNPKTHNVEEHMNVL